VVSNNLRLKITKKYFEMISRTFFYSYIFKFNFKYKNK
jgi:hypothetical protein